MRKFREKYRLLFIMLTGLAFLNMGFVSYEGTLLGLAKDCPLIQNLINYGVEEEKEHAQEKECDGKEIFLSLTELQTKNSILFLVGQQRNRDLDNLSPLTGYTKKFCPPPEVLSI